jgi:hypothetical protein
MLSSFGLLFLKSIHLLLLSFVQEAEKSAMVLITAMGGLA